jgi:2-succinyl-5-enolpyruvyl-6-hydroxy-3-cyclohexene-1-carboxylate synthase
VKGDLQLAHARALFTGLAKAGVTDVVLSPGSRSTPLVLAALEAHLRCHDVIDERSAAFFALGQARVTGRPSVVVATSGTAGAHHLPAAIEACASFMPLILMTADRPAELQSCGALQTIDQLKLFGDHVRAFHEIDLSTDVGVEPLAHVGLQAVLESMHPTPGAVHINVKAKKPLEPESPLGAGAPLDLPSTRTFIPRLSPREEAIDAVAHLVARARRGLVIAGPDAIPSGGDRADLERARGAIAGFVRRTGFPLLAEATSQLRFAAKDTLDGIPICDRFDALFRAGSVRARIDPDLIVQLGRTPTSSGLEKLIADHRTCPRIVIAPRGWHDPDRSAAMMLFSEVEETARRLDVALGECEASADRAAWARRITGLSARAEALIGRSEAADRPLGEGEIARIVVRAAPRGSYLMAGNGLAIRHLDTFCATADNDLFVLAQRGTSGIDGLVSGAAGAASASERPVSLLLGDVGLLHDVGGLFIARAVRTPLVLIAIHNDGGRIFEQLPIATHAGLKEEVRAHFLTPHGITFAPAAALYGIEHHAVRTGRELASAVERAHRKASCTLIEAIVDPHEAASRYTEIGRAMAREEIQ